MVLPQWRVGLAITFWDYNLAEQCLFILGKTWVCRQ